MKKILLAGLVLAGIALPVFATVPSDGVNSVSATGNGTTTAYTVPFRFLAAGDLVVTVNQTVKTLATDYTVKGAGLPTGTVTFTVAPANLAAITIRRDTKLEQPTSLPGQGRYSPATNESALDRLEMQLIDLRKACQPAAGFRLSGMTCTVNADCQSAVCQPGGVCG